MRKTIKTSHFINAPIESVWANISKATGVNEWLPIITACGLDGNKRVCTTEQGDLLETILKIDHEQKIFQYAIDEQPLLPVSDIVGTMHIEELDGNTKLSWDMAFTIQDESHFEMVRQAVEGLYSAGAQGLENISK